MVNVLQTIKAETDEVLTFLEAYNQGEIVCLSDKFMTIFTQTRYLLQHGI